MMILDTNLIPCGSFTGDMNEEWAEVYSQINMSMFSSVMCLYFKEVFNFVIKVKWSSNDEYS